MNGWILRYEISIPCTNPNIRPIMITIAIALGAFILVFSIKYANTIQVSATNKPTEISIQTFHPQLKRPLSSPTLSPPDLYF